MSNDARALADRLVVARTKYIKERNKVLDKAQTRRQVVAESIQDLREEDSALARVEEEAKTS